MQVIPTPTSKKRRGGPGRGQGPKNMSGERGESPVLRVRVPAPLLDLARGKAAQRGLALPDVVRRLLERWAARK